MVYESLVMSDDSRCLEFELPHINANNFPALHAQLLIIWKRRVRISVNRFLMNRHAKKLHRFYRRDSLLRISFAFSKPLQLRSVILSYVMYFGANKRTTSGVQESCVKIILMRSERKVHLHSVTFGKSILKIFPPKKNEEARHWFVSRTKSLTSCQPYLVTQGDYGHREIMAKR